MEILFRRALVLPSKTYFARNALEQSSQVVNASLLVSNHDLFFSEQREWEQAKTNIIHRSTLGVDGITQF